MSLPCWSKTKLFYWEKSKDEASAEGAFVIPLIFSDAALLSFKRLALVYPKATAQPMKILTLE